MLLSPTSLLESKVEAQAVDACDMLRVADELTGAQTGRAEGEVAFDLYRDRRTAQGCGAGEEVAGGRGKRVRKALG